MIGTPIQGYLAPYGLLRIGRVLFSDSGPVPMFKDGVTVTAGIRAYLQPANAPALPLLMGSFALQTPHNRRI